MDGFTEEDLRQVVATYEATKKAALEQRDAALRAFHAAGWRPVDLQRVTGYSRETIRQALNPRAREDINRGRREIRAQRSQLGRQFVVPSTLGELRGPTSGSVQLPDHLDADHEVYDLTDRRQLTRMYATVLYTATSVDDLRNWLNDERLVAVWPDLMLPPDLRVRWERRFPVLARRWSDPE
jgi:hypothetical protein